MCLLLRTKYVCMYMLLVGSDINDEGRAPDCREEGPKTKGSDDGDKPMAVQLEGGEGVLSKTNQTLETPDPGWGNTEAP